MLPRCHGAYLVPERYGRRVRALVIGGIGVDVNVPLEARQWPLDLTADTVFTSGIELGAGHAGSGVALQAAALGLDVTVVDAIGSDLWGEYLQELFPARGVRLDCVDHPAGTRRSVNLVRADGTRLSLHDPRHPYDWTPDARLWRDHLGEVAWVHAVIVSWARQGLRDAVAAGVLTSTDLQDWDGVSEHHREFAELADVVFCSGAKLGGRRDAVVADVFAHGRVTTVVVTLGADGALVYGRGTEPVPVPAVRLPTLEITDTNGAGDAFCATFMTALVGGTPTAQAADQAAVAAAFACAFPGTNTRLVTRAELDALLRPDGA